jgi:hypothetical protein
MTLKEAIEAILKELVEIKEILADKKRNFSK